MRELLLKEETARAVFEKDKSDLEMESIRLRSEIIEASNVAFQQQRIAAEARTFAETVRHVAEEHSLAANMTIAADADM
eukprot:4761283-Heterocapsa_arctica.AAC.1